MTTHQSSHRVSNGKILTHIRYQYPYLYILTRIQIFKKQ